MTRPPMGQQHDMRWRHTLGPLRGVQPPGRTRDANEQTSTQHKRGSNAKHKERHGKLSQQSSSPHQGRSASMPLHSLKVALAPPLCNWCHRFCTHTLQVTQHVWYPHPLPSTTLPLSLTVAAPAAGRGGSKHGTARPHQQPVPLPFKTPAGALRQQGPSRRSRWEPLAGAPLWKTKPFLA